VGSYLLVRGRKSRGAPTTDADPDADALRAKLAAEGPVSFHRAKPFLIVLGVLFFGLLAAVGLLGVVLCGLAAVHAQMQGKPLYAVLYVILTLPVFLLARAFCRACWRRYRFPTDIEVCYSGIRWSQGRRRALLWAEIADVERIVKVIPRFNYPGGLVGAF